MSVTKNGEKTYKPAYWNDEGRHQDLYNELQDFIPGQGSVLDVENERQIRSKLPSNSPKLGRKGKFYHLEALRLGVNQYYDLYNNGLCNRYHGFKKRFGVGSYLAVNDIGDARKTIDMVMDFLILNAAKEIGLWSMDVKSIVRETVEAEEAKVKAATEYSDGRWPLTEYYEDQVPLATVS